MATKTRSTGSLWSVASLVLIVAFGARTPARADEGDPPTRVARLAYIDGSVSMQPGGTDEWVDAPLNRPLTSGDAVWSDANSRVELQLDGSLLRLASRTSLSLLNVDDHVTQLQLTSGTLIVRVRRLDDGETYEIDTPNLALSLLQPGVYRIGVDDSGNTTTVAVRRGEGQVTGGGADYTVDAGQQMVFSGSDSLTANNQPYGQSPFDVWSASRDTRWDHSVSAQYVSPDVVGYTDLDDQGDWTPTPDYGEVWFPRGVEPGWAPYHNGHWAYIAPWGYTWVDDQRWGFAPFHYGRWVSLRGAWGWVPAPPRPRGGDGYVRPVYAPALVAWVGGGAAVAWFALGPRDVFVPSYPVSRGYVNNINISNTTVNRTVIENVYNTTIVNNRTVNVTNVNYMNRGVPGAIAATSNRAFTSAQPVGRNAVQFDPRSGRVQAFAPADVPTRQSLVGQGRLGAPKPPAALQSRGVVARTAPPPPPPPFERRVQALQQNGGRPLSMAAVRQLQPQAAQRAAPIRLAPQATAGGNRPGPAPGQTRPQDQRQQQDQQRQQAQQAQQQAQQQRVQTQQQRQQQNQAQQEQLRQQQQQDQAARRQQADQQRQQAEQQRQQQNQAQQQQRQAQEQQRQEQQRQAQQQQAEQQRQQLEQQRQQAEQQRQQQNQAQQQQRQAQEQQRQQMEQQRQQAAQQASEQRRGPDQRQQEQKPPQPSQNRPAPPAQDNKSGKPDHPPAPNQ